MRRGAAVRALLVAAGVALVAAGAHAAGDCLEPLSENAGWSCHAELSDGGAVDFCLEHSHTFGDDPVSRFFKLNSTGPHASSCSCRARGKSPGAAFGEDKTYLCLDRGSDTVASGKISKRRIAGQIFNVGANLRSTFSCEPEPACDVQAVLDPDLPAESGGVELPPPPGQVRVNVTAAGGIDTGYLPGCSGYASEAPTFTFDVEAAGPGPLLFFFSYLTMKNNAAGILVMTPSGEAHCSATRSVSLVPESGSYGVWIPSTVREDPVQAELVGTYLGQ